MVYAVSFIHGAAETPRLYPGLFGPGGITVHHETTNLRVTVNGPLRIISREGTTTVNRLDHTPARRVWFNFRETRLSYPRSYFARMNYTHQNPVKTRAGAGGQPVSMVLSSVV